jgi:hypothetical protein
LFVRLPMNAKFWPQGWPPSWRFAEFKVNDRVSHSYLAIYVRQYLDFLEFLK